MRAIHRNPQLDSQPSLQHRRHKGQQHGALPIRDQRPQPFQQPRPLQDLLAQRTRRPITNRHCNKSAAQLLPIDSTDELQVVIEHPRQDRLRGHIHHTRVRLAHQPEDKDQVALLIRRQQRVHLGRHVGAHRADDHHRPLLGATTQRHRRPHRNELSLQPGERRRIEGPRHHAPSERRTLPNGQALGQRQSPLVTAHHASAEATCVISLRAQFQEGACARAGVGEKCRRRGHETASCVGAC